MAHTLKVLAFSCLLCGASVSLTPHFNLNSAKKELSVVFPDVAGAVSVEFSYSLMKLLRDYRTETKSLIVRKNAGGHYFSAVDVGEVLKDGDIMNYVVKYFNRDSLLFQTEGVYRIPSEATLSPRLYRRGTTVLFDEFTSNTLDWHKWWTAATCNGGGNGEFQMYTPEAVNTFIRNGVLYLKPTFTVDTFGEDFLHHGTLDVTKQWGRCSSSNENGCYREGSKNNIPPIMSSKVFSKPSIKYGRVEVVAKIPKGDWTWPAIWLLPQSWQGKYGGWPQSGEIDIMESRGNANLKDAGGNDQGNNVVFSTLHWGIWPSQHKQHGHWRKSAQGTAWGDDFHTYSIDWVSDHIRMDVDNQPVLAWSTPADGYWSYSHMTGNNIWSSGGKDAPFDEKMGLILNVAVGGNRGFFPDDWVNVPNGKPWKDSSPTAMMDFWQNKNQWQSTWHGDDVAMQIKSVKMIQY